MSAEPGSVPRMRTRRGSGPVVLARVLSVLALAGFVAGCSGSGAGQSVGQWWSDHGQHLMERANQDVGQISSDSQYDPASLPADGRQLMSDVRAAQADPPPQDKPDYQTYLSGLAKTALTNESGNGDGPLTVTSYQDAEQTRQALDRFGNMLACHHIALDGDMGTCSTPGSDGNDAAPAEAPSSADTPAGEQPSPADTPAGESPSPADASGDEEQAQADLRAVREISFSADLAALNADARTSVNDGRNPG